MLKIETKLVSKTNGGVCYVGNFSKIEKNSDEDPDVVYSVVKEGISGMVGDVGWFTENVIRRDYYVVAVEQE